jgi:SAM-dependent methyltransferase
LRALHADRQKLARLAAAGKEVIDNRHSQTAFRQTVSRVPGYLTPPAFEDKAKHAGTRAAWAGEENMTDVAEYRSRLISAHKGSPYYEQAEKADWLAVFWSADSRFFPLFKQLDLTNVIDFACGHGRHTAQFLDRAGRVTLIDANAAAIDACRKRFARSPNVRCEVNDGTQLPCASRSCNAFLSYDALVHFEATDLIALLSEIARVLKPGGRALLHYSNYQDNPTGTYSDNPHWRNFFSEPMMLHFASRVGLHSIASMTFPWCDESGMDALTLLELT